ncbi:MAG TPA: hypothetical protein VER12_13935 [Polyangiaceae bacterium]|nr:hypothetical protein [Polyangiaceae bacterium]
MLLRLLASSSVLWLSVACGASDGGTTNDDGNGGRASGSAGAPASTGRAQVRFVYQADWQQHLAACAWISDYRIKFGATPVPVSATIDVTSDAPSSYVEVDGRDYADEDVLHIFTCSKSQTSKQTLQLFGKFGTDLALSPAKKYTVTLAGSAASLTEDL